MNIGGNTKEDLTIGSVKVAGRAMLAPMSGITDAPFRTAAVGFGAPYVVSEMIASGELAKQRASSLQRAMGPRSSVPMVVQLAGREPSAMHEAARIACDLGADIIDINMGCPAKKVTGGLSGAALMREPEKALSLLEAVLGAVSVPVTVKMRLGWDDNQRNAPELAMKLESAGASMITVHGRTRCQFYNGKADWSAIAQISASVSIPVIANGDLERVEDVGTMLAVSGAHGVMIGRGAQGRPWFPGAVAHFLSTGTVSPAPDMATEQTCLLRQFDEMLTLYGSEMGVRCARKHLGWHVERHVADHVRRRQWRERLCTAPDPASAIRAIEDFYDHLEERMAA